MEWDECKNHNQRGYTRVTKKQFINLSMKIEERQLLRRYFIMNSRFSVGILATFGLVSTPYAYEYVVESEVTYDNGSIIRVIEYGPDDEIGIWFFDGEQLVLVDPDGNTVASCDRTLPGNEVFGEYGGSAVNIDGTRVQYAGVDRMSLAGFSVDCLTGEADVIGAFVPTYTDPAG